MLGINDYKNMDGQNMWKLATGQAPSLHDNVYTVFNASGVIHNPDWHYFQNVRDKNAGKGSCLYNLKTDPGQSRNGIKEFPDVARDLRNKLQNHLQIKISPLRL